MNPLFATAFSDPAATAALALGLKVALLLGAAFAINALLRRASAAARHLVWLGGLAGTLALAALAGPVRGLDVTVPYWPSNDFVSVATHQRISRSPRLTWPSPASNVQGSAGINLP